jgi:acetylornithine deacetylase/succinyl-diaminopimelate desuccinylase-like protein
MIGDANWIENALAALISTRPWSGQEAAAQKVIERLMLEAGGDDVRKVAVDAALLHERYGFDTSTPTDGMFAVVGAWGQPAASPFILLNGHIDTVPAADGWVIDPLEPRVTNGWMNGLGSADMKAGLVGAIAGVARAKAAGKLRGYVEIQSVPDEEVGGGTGTLACVHELLSAGRIPDLAIVCEPRHSSNRESGDVLCGWRRTGARQPEAGGRERRRGRHGPCSRVGDLGGHAASQRASTARAGFCQPRPLRGRHRRHQRRSGV